SHGRLPRAPKLQELARVLAGAPRRPRLKGREELRGAEVVPRRAAVAALEADMAAARRQQRNETRMAPPVIGQIGFGRNPWIIERMDHQRRHGDAVEEALRGVALIVVLRAAEAVARGAEAMVEFPDAACRHDGRALLRRDLGAGSEALDAHMSEQIALIERVAPTHHLPRRAGEVERR